MDTKSTAYLLLVRETTPEAYEAMSPDETRQCLERWNAWVDAMAAGGKLRDGNPLEAGLRMVAGPGGKRVTDGPFAEAKEMVGGYFLLADTTLDEVTAYARLCPNLQHGMSVEIRPVAGACHLAHALGRETMREPEGGSSAG